MVSTTFAAVALSAVLSPGAVSPAWQSDYGTAIAAASAQQKPVAVFIGQGKAGYAKLVNGGEIPADAGQLLAKSYVCVYVDTDTTTGKKLAGQFDLTSGLVISSKGGNVQALRYTGTVAPTDLTGYLTKYSDPAKVVTTTEQGGLIPAGAVFGGCPNGRCPNSVIYSGASYSPGSTPVYTTYPAFSTCPNGKCPNQR